MTSMKPIKRKYMKKLDLDWGNPHTYIDDEPQEHQPFSSMLAKERSFGPGHISAEARRILDNWMFEHRYYCYPSKLEKQQLSVATNLSIQRISNWFVNSRRRSLPKMIESDGKNVNDFIITRKRQKAATARAAATSTMTSGSDTAMEGSEAKAVGTTPRLSRNSKADRKRDEYFNSEDYEYTLTGERVLKIPCIAKIKAEPTVTMSYSPSPVSIDSPPQQIVDDANEVQTDLQIGRESADTGPKRCISGIINDRTTNLKYLYIVVQPL